MWGEHPRKENKGCRSSWRGLGVWEKLVEATVSEWNEQEIAWPEMELGLGADAACAGHWKFGFFSEGGRRPWKFGVSAWLGVLISSCCCNMATAILALNDTDVFPKISPAGLKSRCQQSWFLLEALGASVSFLFQVLEAASIP